MSVFNSRVSNYRYPKLFYIWMPIMTAVMMFVWINLANPQVTLDYGGIAADSVGNVYIGQKNTILKLSPEGEKLAVINPGTSRGWTFTVANDLLFIDTGDVYYVKDTEGHLMKEIPAEQLNGTVLSYGGLYPQKRFVSAGGTEYVQKGFPRTTFYRIENGESTVIYQMTVYETVCRIVLILAVCGFLVFIPIIIYQFYKVNNIC